MKFNPHPYQKIAMDYLVDHPRCGLFAGMGLGKTAATLSALDCINMVEPGPTLILAPLRVAQSVWPDEVKKWGFDFKVSKMIGNAQERKEAFHTNADIYTMNYENLPWLLDLCFELKRWPFTKIVADESTRLKSFRLLGRQKENNSPEIKNIKKGGAHGSRARALGKVAFHPKVTRFIELTGTPSPNGLIDLWGEMWFLDKGQRLGRTRGAFLERWFTKADMYAPWLPKAHAQQEIGELIKSICLSIKAEDWFKLEDTIIVDVPVTLPATCMALYKKFEKEMYMEIEGKEIEAMNAAAKTIKCLQLSNGAVYTDENGSWTEVHSAKLDALESIIEEANGAPVLVAYHFKSDLARLKKRFVFGKELDKNPSTIEKWNKGEIPLLFAHPASAGHGLNLADGGNIIAMFGHWWDLEQYQQIIERIGPVRQLQAGHPRPVFIYNIRTEGTIDGLVIKRRTDKRRVQDLLLEAARGR
jgi:SNF2 family DNA or RNA helicase